MTSAPPSTLSEQFLHRIAGLAEIGHSGLSDDEMRALALPLLDEVRAFLSSSTASEPAIRPLDDLAEQVIDEYHARTVAVRENDGVYGPRFGFHHLEELLNGLQPKLYALAAMPGTGKSTFALQIAAAVAENGHPALFVSLEHDELDLFHKNMCRVANLSYMDVQKARVPEADIARAAHLLSGHLKGNLYVHYADTVMPSIPDLVERVTEVAGRPPAVVVIDYLQKYVKMLPSGRDDGDLRERVDITFNSWRAMTHQYKTAVIAISEQNRAGYGGSEMGSFKESGGVEYAADVALVVARKDKDDPVHLKATILKQKQGPTGSTDLLMYGDRCSVQEDEEWSL